MMSKRIAVAFAAMASIAASAFGGEPATYVQGKNILIKTGVDPCDRTPTWYAPMASKPYAPVFEILATRGADRRYYPYTLPSP